MKFEEAYCKFERRVLPVYEVTDLYKNNALSFSNQYKDTFVCPECKKAPLVFVNGVTGHFRALPGAKHNIDCPLSQDVLNKRQASAFVSDEKNKEKLVRQLDSLIHLLLREETNSEKRGKEPSARAMSHLLANAGDNMKSKQMPRKRIDTVFTEDDYDCYKFFYGDVQLSWETNRTQGKQRIILKAIGTNRFLCRIRISKNVFSYIPNEYKIDAPYKCKIVFLAVMKQDRKGYKTTFLQRSDYLKIHRFE